MERDKKWRNRKIAETVRDWGYSHKEIADCLGMHYSTVSKIWRRIPSEMSKSKTWPRIFRGKGSVLFWGRKSTSFAIFQIAHRPAWQFGVTPLECERKCRTARTTPNRYSKLGLSTFQAVILACSFPDLQELKAFPRIGDNPFPLSGRTLPSPGVRSCFLTFPCGGFSRSCSRLSNAFPGSLRSPSECTPNP